MRPSYALYDGYKLYYANLHVLPLYERTDQQPLNKVPQDQVREDRIAMEAVVDAYDEEERATGWYYYLEDKLTFPFKAKCISRRMISPLLIGEEVEVVAVEFKESEHEVFVQVRWSERDFAVPLSQLYPIEPDTQTQEGIEDWHYWVARKYVF